MFELSENQMKLVERLVHAGFRPMAIAPYERALCLRKGDCVALLGPAPDGGLQMLVPPTFLLEGNLSVKLKRGNREVFVWKQSELESTPERLRELEAFRTELVRILEVGSAQ
jgi:hypothetical protein